MAHATPGADFDLVYDVGIRPAVPPEYDVPGLVAITFRLHERPRSPGHVYVTSIEVGAALRLGTRLGLDEAESLAFVDSHERVHVFLQLEGVDWEAEEECARCADAAWLALRHPVAARLVDEHRAGLLTLVREGGFWERLVDEVQATRA